MTDWVERCFEYLDVEERVQTKLQERVRRRAEEERVSDQAGLYCLIIEELERTEVPHNEVFALRLDAMPRKEGSRLYHEFVALNPEIDDEKELRGEDFELPIEYKPILDEAITLFGEKEVKVSMNPLFVSPDIAKQRLELLRERKQERIYLSPPERPLKRVYFSRENRLVLELGRRKRGYDPVRIYKQYYEGVTRKALVGIDAGLHDTLRRKGHMEIVPYVQKEADEKRADPLGYYQRRYSGVSRSDLAQRDRALYDLLRKSGQIAKVFSPYRLFTDPVAYFLEAYGNITRTELIKQNRALYDALVETGNIGVIPSRRSQRRK